MDDLLNLLVLAGVFLLWLFRATGGFSSKGPFTSTTPVRVPPQPVSMPRADSIVITIQNTHHYKGDAGLIKLLMSYSGWDYDRVREFLSANSIVNIHKRTRDEAEGLAKELGRHGIAVDYLDRSPHQTTIHLKPHAALTPKPQMSSEPQRSRAVRRRMPSRLGNLRQEPSGQSGETGTVEEKVKRSRPAHPFARWLKDLQGVSQAFIAGEILQGPHSEKRPEFF